MNAPPAGRGSYVLLGADGRPYRSDAPGAWGGHRRSKIYGRLDCPAARRALARGGYAAHRVFFADEATAIAAGYRPCAVCLPEHFRHWRAAREREAGRMADQSPVMPQAGERSEA